MEYVKDFKITDTSSNLTTQTEPYSDFEHHVSPLDPNMSSVARYSPVYTESSAEFNPVVIHQLVAPEDNVQNQQYVNLGTSLESIPTVLCNNDLQEVNNQYLQMVDQNGANIATNTDTGEGLQLVPEREQEVLLITDEATGKIWQEF